MSLCRRSFLAAGTTALAALSGCQTVLQGDRPMVDLHLTNYTDETRRLNLEILRRDRETYDEALVFDRDFEVDPGTTAEAVGTASRENVVPRRPYVLRALPKRGRFQTFEYHWYPGESSSEPETAEIRIRIYRDDETGHPYVAFY